mmetsp:Transcript_45568/g.78760  ORF Transcript_45568/g.78760 Transcript_45568/m.78760 type:complete len:490 (-) Transcript_45568:171-1640(-)|eukprot:CAMPEP_0206365416 /NCGR_PEP_ID=MMETSP0294-20121207/2831_1 /ASSEMBLY_ACC=CAM_ASM_000327 /TAXON_ID=39354 /ORGANISM="Heterosigma akashiwo, Strain CCMP2393" /LENGTH=489 /DNA_ID=CAMNT_0053811261 /DNA_START=120 /DNA_END=1589 /DNA_ORIENTATION=+
MIAYRREEGGSLAETDLLEEREPLIPEEEAAAAAELERLLPAPPTAPPVVAGAAAPTPPPATAPASSPVQQAAVEIVEEQDESKPLLSRAREAVTSWGRSQPSSEMTAGGSSSAPLSKQSSSLLTPAQLAALACEKARYYKEILAPGGVSAQEGTVARPAPAPAPAAPQQDVQRSYPQVPLPRFLVQHRSAEEEKNQEQRQQEQGMQSPGTQNAISQDSDEYFEFLTREELIQENKRLRQMLSSMMGGLQITQQQPLASVKYVSCGHCKQWLQVPLATQIVYCPLCTKHSDVSGPATRTQMPAVQVPKKVIQQQQPTGQKEVKLPATATAALPTGAERRCPAWACPACTLENAAGAQACEACGGAPPPPLPAMAPAAAAAALPLLPAAAPPLPVPMEPTGASPVHAAAAEGTGAGKEEKGHSTGSDQGGIIQKRVAEGPPLPSSSSLLTAQEAYLPQERQPWACPVCTLENMASASACAACETPWSSSS